MPGQDIKKEIFRRNFIVEGVLGNFHRLSHHIAASLPLPLYAEAIVELEYFRSLRLSDYPPSLSNPMCAQSYTTTAKEDTSGEIWNWKRRSARRAMGIQNARRLHLSSSAMYHILYELSTHVNRAALKHQENCPRTLTSMFLCGML